MRTYYEERQALGSRIQLCLVGPAEEAVAVQRLFKRLWLEIFSFEKRCSRFLPGSELSLFNRSAGARQPVTAEFLAVLQAAKRMGSVTGGLFNPFVLPALQRAGYSRSMLAGYTDDDSDDHSSKAVVPVSALELGDAWAGIPYGTALDLGGCGKGYIGDRLADLASEQGLVQGFWFSIGGDTVCEGVNEAGGPWTVYLQPDPRKAARLGELKLSDGNRATIATSTIQLRGGTKAGKKWHHIIDPRSGLPAGSGLRLVTLYGPSLLEADVLASSAIIRGADDLEAWLRHRGIRAGCWQLADRTMVAYGTEVRLYPDGQGSHKRVELS